MKAGSRPVALAAALAVAFAALVAVALHAVERPDEAARARHESGSRALPFAPADVVGLDVAPRDGPALRLERSGGAWRLVAPRDAAASGAAVDELLERLSAIRLRATLTPGTGDAAPAGLEPPRVRLTFRLKDGTSHVLDLGDENAFDRTRYLRSGGRVGVAAGVPEAPLDPGLERHLAPPGGG